MNKNSSLPVYQAAEILTRFNPHRNWSWFLALNRIGKTSDCPTVPFEFVHDEIFYRLVDIVKLLQSNVAPLMTEDQIYRTIAWFDSPGDKKAEEALALVDQLERGAGEDDDVEEWELEEGDDLRLCMNEDSLMYFFAEMDYLRKYQVNSARNLAVLTYIIEMVAEREGEDKYPNIHDIVAFGRDAIAQAFGYVDKIDLMSCSLHRKASTAIDPNKISAGGKGGSECCGSSGGKA